MSEQKIHKSETNGFSDVQHRFDDEIDVEDYELSDEERKEIDAAIEKSEENLRLYGGSTIDEAFGRVKAELKEKYGV